RHQARKTGAEQTSLANATSAALIGPGQRRCGARRPVHRPLTIPTQPATLLAVSSSTDQNGSRSRRYPEHPDSSARGRLHHPSGIAMPRRAPGTSCAAFHVGVAINREYPEEGTMHEVELHTLLTGLVFGETPRWHDDRLWFSDMSVGEVLTVDLAGRREVVAQVPTLGSGFLPDGRLLIVSIRDGLLLRRGPDGALVTHADLTGLERHPWNDLVVDGRGNAYVNNIGFEFPGGEFHPGIVALVTPDGATRQVGEGLAFPNGMAVTPDNATLIVAESYGDRLSAFDIAADGSLSNQRTWASLGGGHPDGICLDAHRAVSYRP